MQRLLKTACGADLHLVKLRMTFAKQLHEGPESETVRLTLNAQILECHPVICILHQALMRWHWQVAILPAPYLHSHPAMVDSAQTHHNS